MISPDLSGIKSTKRVSCRRGGTKKKKKSEWEAHQGQDVGREEDDHEERHGIQDARASGWLRLLLRHRRRRRRWGEVADDGGFF